MVQGGAPLKMSVGTSDLKSRRNNSVNPLTAKSLMELRNEISCSNEGVKKIAQKIREVSGCKAVAVASQEAVEGGKALESFYTITRLKFEVKKTEEVEVKGKDGQVKKIKRVSTVVEERDLIHVKDPSEFVLHACNVRGLDPTKAICRLGMDAGQGSLKGMVNIAEGKTLRRKMGTAATTAKARLMELSSQVLRRSITEVTCAKSFLLIYRLGHF